ncbi:MAG: HAD family phosphatase [Anaerolineae bacterium]|nr:HAD family phosphatase [Anaerolineae bacterium]
MMAHDRRRGDATRAVLWDMDGVLVDSAEYHYAAWREALAREGYDIGYDEFRATFGQRNDTILRLIFGEDLPDAEVERIAGLKEALYRQFVRERGIAPLPGVLRWLNRLHTAGWRQAVASAAPRANVDAILRAVGIERYFDAITSGEDVTRGKPDPQVYLISAQRLGVPPQRCVVVEDAPAGLEGARRAGMRCVGVTSTHDHLDADVVVASLDELRDDSFERLLAPGTVEAS